MNPRNLECGDRVHVVHDGAELFPHTYEVLGADYQDIGLTEVVVVALRAGCDRYKLRGVDGWTLVHDETGREVPIEREDINTLDNPEDIRNRMDEQNDTD